MTIEHVHLSAPSRASTRAASPPRLVVEAVTPAVGDGRFAPKRLVGDTVTVAANVYKEGHDLLAGRIRYRGPGDRAWRVALMEYDVNFDRCRGTFPVDRPGPWAFTVEAWTDRFGSWQSDMAKRVAAGQALPDDWADGAGLVEGAARHSRGAARRDLEQTAALLRDAQAPDAERAGRALDRALARRMLDALPPDDLTRHPTRFPLWVDRERAGFAAWYEMFPRSQSPVPGRPGTFTDAARLLPRLAELGFDVVYLPPIHPIGRTHRKGPDNALTAGPDDPGSPWAIGNEHGGHTAVAPELGTLDDFERFVGAAQGAGLEIALDYALQCSPDHPWVREHPEWFFARPDGTIRYAENPPKKYEDIYALNFWCEDYRALWEAARDVLRFWIARGVRTFRVDNPHTKPFAFWEWVIAEIQREHPDVVFLAEAFTRPARMQGLAKLGFTQSYTYFTWRTSAGDLREYLTELTRTEMVEYFRPNFFANTPDILHEYLQQGGRPAFRVRLVLAATLSPLYGIYSGYELCENVAVRPGSEEPIHSEKYQLVSRDWDAPGNLNADLARLNRLRREHPALQQLANLEFAHSENDQILCYHKHAPGDDLVIVVNLDPHHAQEGGVHVPPAALGVAGDAPFELEDLLSGGRYAWRGARNVVRLDPQQQVAQLLRVRRPGPA